MPRVCIGVLRRLGLLAALGLLLAAAPLTWAAPALAGSWREGTAERAFSISSLPAGLEQLSDAGDPSIRLSTRVLTAIGRGAAVFARYPSGTRLDPRTVVPLDGVKLPEAWPAKYSDDLLISGGKDSTFVALVDRSGNPVWRYRAGQDGILEKSFSAQPAEFDGEACVLIADRNACRVFAVSLDTEKRMLWQYGTTDEPGIGVDQLADPFCATQLPATASERNGDVLIADNLGGNRVIRVHADDYRADADNMGYDADSIVWQYGVTGTGGSSPGHLNHVRSPQLVKLPSGERIMLITDDQSGHVIGVDYDAYEAGAERNGFDAGDIDFEYDGVDGATMATYVTSGPLKGQVVIADTKNDRILWVDYATGRLVDELDVAGLDRPADKQTDACDPRCATYDGHGGLWVAEAGYERIVRIGNKGTAAVVSGDIDCGSSAKKAFTKVKLAGTTSSVTSIRVRYRVDGGSWGKRALHGPGTLLLPAGATGTTISYELRLTSTYLAVSPVVGDLTFSWTKPTTGSTGDGGGETKTGGGANSGGDTGTYTYPTLGGSGVSGSGTGAGGSGGGTGAGSSGTGAGGSGTTAARGQGSGANVEPPSSAASGSKSSVRGVQVQGLKGVSGVPLKAGAGAHLVEERQGTDDGSLPVGILAVSGAVAAAGLLLPWPIMAARIRRLTGHDHTQRRYYPPFWPLR